MSPSAEKMATNHSESLEFDVNNQLGVEGLEENTTQSDNTNADETNRAGGQSLAPREMNFQLLLEFIKQQNEEMSEKMRRQNEELCEKLSEK